MTTHVTNNEIKLTRIIAKFRIVIASRCNAGALSRDVQLVQDIFHYGPHAIAESTFDNISRTRLYEVVLKIVE